MKNCYQNICTVFHSGEELMKAIVSNNPDVYYFLTQMMVWHSEAYRNTEAKEGRETADRLLTDTLVVLQRQIRHKKAELTIKDSMITVTRDNLELLRHLENLFTLLLTVSPSNPLYEKFHSYEERLVKGSAFTQIYNLKDSVLSSLHNIGCTDRQDKEDLFNEALVVFWKKLSQAEVGIYFTGNQPKPEEFRVYNRNFYQHCKLGTFLIGVARNLFMNKTRNTDYQVFRNKTEELSDRDDLNPAGTEPETPALVLFLFYRMMVEERKIRTLISLLQYDCGLEDREVRDLIGINNARIHSSRLRNHFHEWYEKNIHIIPELLDQSNDYLNQREHKKEKLNKKINDIDLYRRSSLHFINLDVFREEFRSIPEFRQFHRIFRLIFYFTAIGKASALSGLPDEKLMRSMMEGYKSEMTLLPSFKAILLLLFYGSDEPAMAILGLLSSVLQELKESGGNEDHSGVLVQQLNESLPYNDAELTNCIYDTNQHLFKRMLAGNNITGISYENIVA